MSSSRVRCRCERCGTIWVHDATRIAALLRDPDLAEREKT